MKFLYPVLVVLLAVFAVAPLEYPGAFQSHTGLTAVYNLIDLDHSPLQFWNWSPTLGHTFDLLRGDGALPYLVAEIFHWSGFSYLAAIKLVYALAWLASGLTMYALARRWLSENGALLASIIYVYLPFHIATIYVRGALAEAAAWAVMPLALLAVVSQPATGDSRQKFILRLVPFALLFLTQPGLAILFALVVLAIASLLDHTPFAIRSTLFDILGGLLIGALLDLPTILRYGANIARDGFNANFVLPFQLFSSLWGFGASTGSYLDKFPLQLGVVPVGLAIIASALAWRAPAVESNSTANPGASRLQADLHLPTAVVSNDRRTIHRTIVVFVLTCITLTLLTFEIAAPLWNLLGVFVAYPWQLLAFVGLVLAIVAGSAVELDARLARPAMLAFFVALPVVASYSYLAPQYFDANPTRPPIAIFGNHEIALWDYRIVGPLRHGATVRLQLTWQALRPVDHDYTIFVHAVNDNGNTYAQDDAKPQDGALPTITWMPGQIVSDTHTLQIDVDGPREGYHLEFGMYVAATGKRALTAAGVDQIILPRPGDPEPTITDQLPPKQ